MERNFADKITPDKAIYRGAIPGALPPLIGWTASHGSISAGGAALFAIVFLWQIPHFMAIAWMYRDDYAKAGFPMLPVIEPDGRRTGQQAVLYAAALLPISLLPYLIALSGLVYLGTATTLGVIKAPSSLTITLGSRPTMMATTLLVVPRSIPMIFPMILP